MQPLPAKIACDSPYVATCSRSSFDPAKAVFCGGIHPQNFNTFALGNTMRKVSHMNLTRLHAKKFCTHMTPLHPHTGLARQNRKSPQHGAFFAVKTMYCGLRDAGARHWAGVQVFCSYESLVAVVRSYARKALLALCIRLQHLNNVTVIDAAVAINPHTVVSRGIGAAA